MKYFNIYIMVLLCVAVLFGCSNDKRPKYKNLAFEFSIKYNPIWEMRDKVNSAVVAFLAPRVGKDDFFQETLTITVQDLVGKMSFASYTQGIIEQTKALGAAKDVDVNIIESSPMTLSGVPAHRLIYTLTKYGNPPEAVKAGVLPSVDTEGMTLKVMLVWAVRNEKLYLITFVSYDDGYQTYLKDVNEMISSFRFL